MRSSTLHPHKKPHEANRDRLYWAVFRVFIALSSTCFFLYYLVNQCKVAMELDHVVNHTALDEAIIDWLNLNGYEVEYTQYLVRNISLLPPDPYSDDSDAPINLSFQALRDIQQRSLALLRDMADLMQQTEDMLKDNQAIELQWWVTEVAIQGRSSLSSFNFSWGWYFEMVQFWHDLRFFLINVVSNNIDYQRQQIASYSVTLTALLYYRENLSCLRDAVLKYYHYDEQATDTTTSNGTNSLPTPTPTTPTSNNNTNYYQDQVVEYNKATNVYAREVAQKIPPELNAVLAQSQVLPQYQHCDSVVRHDIDTLYYNHNNNINDSMFNSTEWYECVILMIHSQSRVRSELRRLLQQALEEYTREVTTGLVVACVGILLELLAAGTLIQQALPVLILYYKMQTVVKTSVQMTSTNANSNSTGEKARDS